jgi:hypothetical protein
MIRIACTNCRQVLTIDDAFAGGVCRCQHCGTIQTVPSTAAGSEVAVGGPNLGGARVGPTNGSPFAGPGLGDGTGLDDLAGAVASSGLSSRRLRHPGATAGGPAATAPRRAAPDRQNLVPLFAITGAVIVVLLGVIVYLATRSAPPPTPAASDGQQATTTGRPAPPAAAAAANFCGTPLTGDTVVYVLDRGEATQEIFGALKDATLKSAASLGSDHHFQIVFWSNGGDEPTAYPAAGPAYATQDNVEAARRTLDDVSAYGQTDAKPAVALALTHHPDVIVLATAKGWVLDEQWTKDLIAARGSAPTRFDTFSLGGTNPDPAAAPPLKALADRTGGAYAVISNDALKAAAE